MKATVKRNDEQSNIFKRGNLVINKHGVLILVTANALDRESIFEGVQITGTFANGTFIEDWSKAGFSLFSGSVLLEQ